MNFDPNIPQPIDIPADSQNDLLNNFLISNQYFNTDHVPFSGVITNIAQTNPCRVTSPVHTLATGDMVTFFNLYNDTGDPANPPAGPVTGMGQLNGNTYTITVVDENTFTLNGVDATGFTAYIPNVPYSSGGNYSSASLLQGYHKKLSFFQNQQDPNLSPPAASLYTKFINNITQLFFQNNNANSTFQLTGIQVQEKESGRGIITPFGLIINFGEVSFTSPSGGPATITFPIPYTSTVYTLQVCGFSGSGFNIVSSWFVTNVNLTDFQGFSSVTRATFFYLAIGT